VQHELKRPTLADRVTLRLSFGRHIDGLWIGALEGPEPSLIRVEQALVLIKEHDRRRYDRLRLDLERVWVRLLPMAVAQFNYELKACELDERFVCTETTPIEMIASCIVHEATHARIWRRGIGYDEHLRERIEKVCIRRQLAFAARLPDGDYVRYAAEHALKTPQEYWSDNAFADRHDSGQTELARHVGLPRWLERALRTGGRWYRRLKPRIPYAAFSSFSSHFPSVATPFILARWVKARWPAATFSDLPPHALSAAACSARP
jgi:hypothetical protein